MHIPMPQKRVGRCNEFLGPEGVYGAASTLEIGGARLLRVFCCFFRRCGGASLQRFALAL